MLTTVARWKIAEAQLRVNESDTSWKQGGTGTTKAAASPSGHLAAPPIEADGRAAVYRALRADSKNTIRACKGNGRGNVGRQAVWESMHSP